MIPKKWMTVIGTVLLVFLMATGYYAVAADYGSKDDPVVSLSYINDVLMPALEAKLDKTIDAKTAEFETTLQSKLQEYTSGTTSQVTATESNYQTILADKNFINSLADAVTAKLKTQVGTSASQAFAVVKIPNGKTMTCSVGCEVLLRIGTATCKASTTPGLINITTGATLNNGGTLSQNCLYLVSIQGRGVTASGGDATVLVRGSYTIK